MPIIRPISDLRNNANEISEYCHKERRPVYITKNGVGDLVVQSIESYEQQQSQLGLYARLLEAEAQVADGDAGEDFFKVARSLRSGIHGNV